MRSARLFRAGSHRELWTGGGGDEGREQSGRREGGGGEGIEFGKKGFGKVAGDLPEPAGDDLKLVGKLAEAGIEAPLGGDREGGVVEVSHFVECFRGRESNRDAVFGEKVRIGEVLREVGALGRAEIGAQEVIFDGVPLRREANVGSGHEGGAGEF